MALMFCFFNILYFIIILNVLNFFVCLKQSIKQYVFSFLNFDVKQIFVCKTKCNF